MAINPDRISAAQAKLAEDPHDVDSWVLLIKHCQCRSVKRAEVNHSIRQSLIEIYHEHESFSVH